MNEMRDQNTALSLERIKQEQEKVAFIIEENIKEQHVKEEHIKIEVTSPPQHHERHEATALVGFRYMCDVCKGCFYCEKDLTEHLENHCSPPTDKKPYKCDTCSYASAKQCNVTQHKRRSHAGELPFSCKECDYRCFQKQQLKCHEASKHTGEKPYQCDFCSYATCNSSQIKIHTRLHTGERPFSCSTCAYKCNTTDQLKIHKMKHSGSKPFQCGICSFSSAKPADMKRHLRLHTGERPFSCTRCEYKCNRKHQLSTHQMKHDDDENRVVENLPNHTPVELGDLPWIRTKKKLFHCTWHETCSFAAASQSELTKHMHIHVDKLPLISFIPDVVVKHFTKNG